LDKATKLEINAAMKSLSEGDRSAFDKAYSLLWPLVLNVTKRLIGNTVDAEDVAQETLVKVFAQAQKYDHTKDAVAWVLVIARFEFMTLKKSRLRKKENSGDGMEEIKSNDPSADEHIEARQIETAIQSIVADLPAQDQETLRRYLESNETKSPLLRKRFERALKRIRDAWKEAYG